MMDDEVTFSDQESLKKSKTKVKIMGNVDKK